MFGLAVSTFLLFIPWYSPIGSTAKAQAQEAVGRSHRADCCKENESSGSISIFCSRAPQYCPFALQVAGTGQSKRIMVTVLNTGGHFAKGANGFCIKFTDESGQTLPMTKVQLDVTLQIGHIEAVRAVHKLASSGVGRYCAHVVLPFPGHWKLTLRYESRSRRGKLSIQEDVI